MTALLVIPFAIGDMLAGEYQLFGIERCSSLQCCGEERPVVYMGDPYCCKACGTVWDPSEASC
jgi:hypothetical protein